MVIYELLCVVIVLWIFVILVKKDLFSPSSVLCLSYIFSIICAIYNIDNWKINLHYNTFFVIIIGIISFLISSLLFDFTHSRKKSIKKNIEYIKVKKYKLLLINCISLIIFVIYLLFFIKAIGGVSSLLNFSESMEAYRNKTMIHHITLIPSWINFLSKICRAVCYVYTYILINNYIISKNHNKKEVLQKNILHYIFGIFLYLPLTLMSGGRYDLIVFILYVIFVFSILYTIENKKRLNSYKIIKIGIVLIVVLVGFSSYKGLVGRNSDSSTIDYITEYFGGSIEIFDIYMQEPHYRCEYFGQETFAGIRKFLYQVKLLNDQGVSEDAMEFRTIYNGKVLGNVYTGFRKLYHDFGIFGVIILQSLLAIIFNKLYYDCFYKKNKMSISFNIILTGTIFFCLALHSYSESFYSTVLSFNYISFFIIVYFIIKFLDRIELRWK